MLDLVIGHTSDSHPWYAAAANDPDDHRYIWSGEPGRRFVSSPGSRGGYFLTNFLPCQPALNFGYARPDPTQPWRQPVDADGPRRNRQTMRDIMAHWLSLGVAGFRCDMAYSLVKDDPGHVATSSLWRETRGWLQGRFPQVALIAEWGQPGVAVGVAGFHAAFFLHFQGEGMRSLWDNGTGQVRDGDSYMNAFVDPEGRGSPKTFLAEWRAADRLMAGAGYSILPTANHDCTRLACGPRTAEHLKTAFALQLTWPSLPAICSSTAQPSTVVASRWPVMVMASSGSPEAGRRTPTVMADGRRPTGSARVPSNGQDRTLGV
jgi:maltose alpha-D-glucosyltransferase/alpha-amylase